MARKRRNELIRDIAGFGIAGVGLTVGSSVVSSIGGPAAAGVGAGFAKGASFFPAIATVLVAKHIVKQSNKLQPKRRRR